MTTSDARTVLRLPAREIPVPASVSEQAQAILALGPIAPPQQWPDLDDLDGWRALIAELDLASMQMAPGSDSGADVEEIYAGGARVFVITPAGVAPDDRRIYLEIHGGAFIQGGGEICRIRGIDNANRIGARSWSVDYRMPPDHPFPAALDDCVAVYRTLLETHRPQEIVIGGVSAGANLAAATILRARDEGLPLPAGAVLATPVSDLTESGDTWQTNLGLDNFLTERTPCPLLYAAGHDLRDPYLSPVFADFDKGFPPTLLLSGTRDVLLSDTVRLHRALRAADVPAELHVWEAAAHGGFLGRAPEDQERTREIRRFLGERWAASDDTPTTTVTNTFHPDLSSVARWLPHTSVSRRTLRPIRRLIALTGRRTPEDIEVTTVGAVPVRIHRPLAGDPPRAALLWIHGGGYVMGTAAQDDELCRHFARELGILVAAVDYRLAPEHPFPTPLHDCYDALTWLASLAEVDASRIMIGGASAGGGLAAALALLAHDRGEVRPILQLLAQPMLDDRTALRTDIDQTSFRMWNNNANRFGWQSYLGRPPGSADIDPLAAPARRDDLSGLPPAWIGVGTLDLFYDEDLAYAERLAAAGVEREVVIIDGAFHGFDSVRPKAGVSAAFRSAQTQALAAALGSTAGPTLAPSKF